MNIKEKFIFFNNCFSLKEYRFTYVSECFVLNLLVFMLKPSAEKQRKYRKNLKENEQKWREHLERERERDKKRRLKLREDLKKNKTKLMLKRKTDAERQRKYRAKKRLSVQNTDEGILTSSTCSNVFNQTQTYTSPTGMIIITNRFFIILI